MTLYQNFRLLIYTETNLVYAKANQFRKQQQQKLRIIRFGLPDLKCELYLCWITREEKKYDRKTA